MEDSGQNFRYFFQKYLKLSADNKIKTYFNGISVNNNFSLILEFIYCHDMPYGKNHINIRI